MLLKPKRLLHKNRGNLCVRTGSSLVRHPSPPDGGARNTPISKSQRQRVPSHNEIFLNIHDTITTMAFSSPTLEILKLQLPDSQAHSVGNRLQICGAESPELLNIDDITASCDLVFLIAISFITIVYSFVCWRNKLPELFPGIKTFVSHCCIYLQSSSGSALKETISHLASDTQVSSLFPCATVALYQNLMLNEYIHIAAVFFLPYESYYDAENTHIFNRNGYFNQQQLQCLSSVDLPRPQFFIIKVTHKFGIFSYTQSNSQRC